ncbi:MAG: Twitching motility protein PilT [Deltaproteobacteria bacterium]|nr:Twitching motility protein PilT [Deltaproteobacteria bacterium]
MSKLDVYLRSIERFGASGAILTSGQPVTLRFPSGDRQATQVTPHDQLVALVREVAPPSVLDQIDQHRQAKFEYESNGTHYALSVAPRPGAWQVLIEAMTGQAPAAAPTRPAAEGPAPWGAPGGAPGAAPGGAPGAGEMTIERGQYDAPAVTQRVTASGSTMLDELTRAARAARATDLYLQANAVPMQRVAGELVTPQSIASDGDQLSRELGLVAPAEARAAWSEHGSAVFAYGDGAGRVRVTLGRDQRGPNAALRLLPDEPPTLEQLGFAAEVDDWLARSGLIVITGSSGAGKTVTLAALVRALGERRRRVVAIEDPIELVHTSSWISQRAIGAHVTSVAAGVASAMSEGADAIVVGSVTSPGAATAIIDAIAGGHLVLATIGAPIAQHAIERLVELVVVDRRDVARTLLADLFLGAIRPVVGRGGGRTFEIAPRHG